MISDVLDVSMQKNSDDGGEMTDPIPSIYILCPLPISKRLGETLGQVDLAIQAMSPKPTESFLQGGAKCRPHCEVK